VSDAELEELDESTEDEEPERAKRPKREREPVIRRYRAWLSTLPRAQRVVAIVITIVLVVFGLVYLSAVIAMEPWYKNEFQEPIDKDPQWIEVTADPFQFEGYAEEQSTAWTQQFDFPTVDDEGIYVSKFTMFLIWEDDARTEADTFLFLVMNKEGKQIISGGSSQGYTYMTARLNNTAIKHVENWQGWSVQVTCQEAKDGYIGPAGIIKIPDDGNTFTVRFEWAYFKEHNPEWE